MKYVIGLGNPGLQYDGTRHNVGRMLVEKFAQGAGALFEGDKNARARMARAPAHGPHEIMYVLPETYMNRSGETAAYLTRAYGARPDDMIVVYDDLDLPLGTVRVAQARGNGGHNGIKSVADALGSKDFIRVRIGIAQTSFWTGKPKRPQGGDALSRFVLARFTRHERLTIEETAPRVRAVIEAIVTDGVAKAMNEYNSKQ